MYYCMCSCACAVFRSFCDCVQNINVWCGVGWNYCSFFLIKESLSIVFQTANLLDEALAQYTELEVLYLEEGDILHAHINIY